MSGNISNSTPGFSSGYSNASELQQRQQGAAEHEPAQRAQNSEDSCQRRRRSEAKDSPKDSPTDPFTTAAYETDILGVESLMDSQGW